MNFGRVHGEVISTLKVEGILGVNLLVVQPLDKNLQPVDTLQVAADVVEAGPGDLCLMVASREAALAMRDETFVPVDLAIIGIVDELAIQGGIGVDLHPGTNHFT